MWRISIGCVFNGMELKGRGEVKLILLSIDKCRNDFPKLQDFTNLSFI
jgi:hypothetical protein